MPLSYNCCMSGNFRMLNNLAYFRGITKFYQKLTSKSWIIKIYQNIEIFLGSNFAKISQHWNNLIHSFIWIMSIAYMTHEKKVKIYNVQWYTSRLGSNVLQVHVTSHWYQLQWQLIFHITAKYSVFINIFKIE